MAPLPAAIGWGKAVGYNNRIYLAGGLDGSSTELATVYVYNVSADTWSTATPMPEPKFGGAFAVTGNKLVYAAGADTNGISNSVYVGTIDGSDPLVIGWATANKFPGIPNEVVQASSINPAELIKNIFSQVSDETDAVYPPGTMYRFDGAPWGSDGIIAAGGSPTAAWDPANPNPSYIYKPSTDTWTKQGDVPVAVLGSSLGTVHDGNTWKLIVASGLGLSAAETTTQIWTDNIGSAATTFPLTVNVAAGWNMVSIPGLLPTNQNVSTWWPGKDPAASVFRFQSGYQPVTVAAPGQGYWMKNLAIQTYNTGDEWPAGGINIVAHNPIPGFSGWNMIGGYEQTVNTSGLTTTPPGLITGTIYKYTPGSGYQAATQLVPGFGYWVKLTAAGSINIPSAAEKGIASALNHT